MRGDERDHELLTAMDPAMRDRILAMREREDRQEAEKALVRKWKWERLVPLRHGQKRRQREAITAELHPSAWPSSPGSARPKTCGSIDTGSGGLRREAYWGFHGEERELHPVVWRVTHGVKRGRYDYTAHYCDDHLPAEYRPAQELTPVATGGTAP